MKKNTFTNKAKISPMEVRAKEWESGSQSSLFGLTINDKTSYLKTPGKIVFNFT